MLARDYDEDREANKSRESGKRLDYMVHAVNIRRLKIEGPPVVFFF